jgi:hypothetical protein
MGYQSVHVIIVKQQKGVKNGCYANLDKRGKEGAR